ncbi:MAG: exodeoxyribonuclease VII large subunit [Pseudomonadota bacterium]
MPDMGPSNREVLSVTDINRAARRLLEGEFGMVFVEGEISNFTRPSSGHWYLTLKDANAQIRCAMFAGRNRLVRFTPKNGLQVVIRGRVSLYEGRGDFQLIAEFMEEAGDGALRRAFDQLKTRLDAEGLFDSARKKPLPSLPRHLGVITSPSGAAIRDVLHVLERRFPAMHVSVIPVPVQGDEASPAIVRAIEFANRYQADPFDALLVTRGGGSLEDLWAFNTEQVARAIADSAIPVVSAVGHETDFTIADFVADQRAPTPSAAAEMLSPDANDWLLNLARTERALFTAMERRIRHHENNLGHLTRRLRHPGRRLQELSQRLDDLEMRSRSSIARYLRGFRVAETGARLERAMLRRMEQVTSRLRLAASRLRAPAPLIRQKIKETTALELRLAELAARRLQDHRARLARLESTLIAYSPQATLDRGYAIVRVGDRIVRSTREITPGTLVTTTIKEGEFDARVEETRDAPSE